MDISKNHSNSFFFGWLPWAVYSAVVIHGAVISPERIPSWLLQFKDKHIHSAEFFILFWFTLNAFRRLRLDYKTVLFAVFCFGIFMGVLTEILQFWAPLRSPDIFDFAADLTGLTFAGFCAALFVKKKE